MSEPTIRIGSRVFISLSGDSRRDIVNLRVYGDVIATIGDDGVASRCLVRFFGNGGGDERWIDRTDLYLAVDDDARGWRDVVADMIRLGRDRDALVELNERDIQNSDDLADYIIRWLTVRNGGELSGPMTRMSDGDREHLRTELVMILKHGGRPPNWIAQ